MNGFAAAAAILIVASCSSGTPRLQGRASRVLVEKAARRMTLLDGDTVLRTYRIALGTHPVGPKQCEGDGRTPEGDFTIDFHKPDSAFYRALHISYPAPDNLRKAAELGCRPGGDIMIHGVRNGFGWLGPILRRFDTTSGCIGLSNEQMDEIWDAIPDGTPISIVP